MTPALQSIAVLKIVHHKVISRQNDSEIVHGDIVEIMSKYSKLYPITENPSDIVVNKCIKSRCMSDRLCNIIITADEFSVRDYLLSIASAHIVNDDREYNISDVSFNYMR